MGRGTGFAKRRPMWRIALLFGLVAGAACDDASQGHPIDASTVRPDGGGGPDAGAGIDAPPSAGNNYDQDGPIPFTTRSDHVVNGASSFNVTVYMPTTPGLHPVVSFSCGS